MPMNYAKTAMLLALPNGDLRRHGHVVAGQQGMVIAFFVALAMNVFSFWNSDTIVLRMFGAQRSRRAHGSGILPYGARSGGTAPNCRCRACTF